MSRYKLSDFSSSKKYGGNTTEMFPLMPKLLEHNYEEEKDGLTML